MGGFSLWHILLFAVVLLLVFGGNRFSSMMGDVAKGLKSFKQGMADEDQPPRMSNDPRQLPPNQQQPYQQPPQQPYQQPPQPTYQQPPIDLTPEPRPTDPAASPPPPPPPPPSDDTAR